MAAKKPNPFAKKAMPAKGKTCPKCGKSPCGCKVGKMMPTRGK